MDGEAEEEADNQVAFKQDQYESAEHSPHNLLISNIVLQFFSNVDKGVMLTYCGDQPDRAEALR